MILLIILLILLLIFVLLSFKKSLFTNLKESYHYYVLNLKRSIDRNELCKKEFKKYDINNYSFINGIDSKNYSNKENMLLDNKYSTNFCMNGLNHIGCYLSHLKAIQEFYDNKNGYEYGIILEDDFIFNDNPNNHLNSYLKYFKTGTDMVVLSDCEKEPGKIFEKKEIPTWNAVGYMINKKAANILLNTLRPNSNFLNDNYQLSDCLYDFALFKTMEDNLKYKWFTLISQRPELISTITNTIRNNIETDYVNAENYKFDMCNHAVNLGDTASKKFVELLCNVKFGTNKKTIGSALTIGSILSYSRKDTIVWGSGFLNDNKLNNFQVNKIYSVRGPKSYDKLINNDIKCPRIFGDPFFIVPLLYTPTTSTSNKIGIIPHYMEKKSKELNDYINNFQKNNIILIDIQTTDIQKFINEIYKCSEIHSSSLHGVIIAMAYKIPTKWIKLSSKTGDGFKYYDFFESLEINYKNNQLLKIGDVYTLHNMLNLGIQIIKSCPFMKNNMKESYCKKWEQYTLL